MLDAESKVWKVELPIQGSYEKPKWVTRECVALTLGLRKKKVGNDAHCDGQERRLADVQ